MKIFGKGLIPAVAIGAVVAAAAVFAAPPATMQFPTAGWGGMAPGIVQCGTLKNANMNVTTDQKIPISFPSVNYEVAFIAASGASISLDTAAGGIYTAASKGGTAVVAAGQAYSTLTAAAVNSAGSNLLLTLNVPTAEYNVSTLYLSLTTAQGAASTANFRVYCRPHYG